VLSPEPLFYGGDDLEVDELIAGGGANVGKTHRQGWGQLLLEGVGVGGAAGAVRIAKGRDW
jgi:hypothetical protein